MIVNETQMTERSNGTFLVEILWQIHPKTASLRISFKRFSCNLAFIRNAREIIYGLTVVEIDGVVLDSCRRSTTAQSISTTFWPLIRLIIHDPSKCQISA